MRNLSTCFTFACVHKMRIRLRYFRFQRLRSSENWMAMLANTAKAPSVSRIVRNMMTSLRSMSDMLGNECACHQLKAECEQAHEEPAPECFCADAASHALSDPHTEERGHHGE